jgi:hypothetical protein
VLADVNRDLLTLVVVGIHQDPLNQVVAVLIPGNVDEWDARTIWMRSGNDAEVTFKELHATDLEALFDNFGSELIDTVAVGIAKDMVNDSALVWRGAVLAEMLNTPISKLPVGDEINVVDDFFDGRALGYG